MKYLFLLLFLVSALIAKSQILLELQRIDYLNTSAIYKRSGKIKSECYTFNRPFPMRMEYRPEADTVISTYVADTITYCSYYNKSGYLTSKTEELTDTNFYYKIQYHYDNQGRLLESTEVNERRIRLYKFAKLMYHYSDQLDSITAYRLTNTDTVISTLQILYDHQIPYKIIELNRQLDTMKFAALSKVGKRQLKEVAFEVDFARSSYTVRYNLSENNGIESYQMCPTCRINKTDLGAKVHLKKGSNPYFSPYQVEYYE